MAILHVSAAAVADDTEGEASGPSGERYRNGSSISTVIISIWGSHTQITLKKVAWRIQELAEGGLSDRVRARIEELADAAPMRWRSSGNGASATAPAVQTTQRDPRLPEPGTVLTRAHGGVEHQVTVLDDGFEYRGQRYSSLSKIAREISGTNWNGYLYFGLQRRTRKRTGEGS